MGRFCSGSNEGCSCCLVLFGSLLLDCVVCTRRVVAFCTLLTRSSFVNMTAASGGHIRAAPPRAERWCVGRSLALGRPRHKDTVCARMCSSECARASGRDVTRAHPNNSTKRSSYRRGGGRARTPERRADTALGMKGRHAAVVPRRRFGSVRIAYTPIRLQSHRVCPIDVRMSSRQSTVVKQLLTSNSNLTH